MVAAALGCCFSVLGALALGDVYYFRQKARAKHQLSPAAKAKVDELWNRMDKSGHASVVTRADATEFFGKRFGKLSVEAMFSQVDVDHDGQMQKPEWDAFWVHVKRCSYTDEAIVEEVSTMLLGGAWINWKDGRHPGHPKKAASSQSSFKVPSWPTWRD
mmetsp:Transcript_47972/g.154786  ORF Transcript_47972/g.154786 Transcript_47972/m.154786 type:complete len:159 (-) Transcript_47972:110-586(-)